MRKYALIVVGVLVVAVVAVALVVPRVAGSAWARGRVEEALASATGRPVELGSIRFGWSDGLSVSDVSILDPDGVEHEEGPFLRAERLAIRVGFRELLSRRIDIRDLYLGAPSIVVVRDADGHLSISDLLERGGETKAGAPRATPSAAPSGTGATPVENGELDALGAVRARIRLEGGRLLFVDHALAARWSLEDVTGSARLVDRRLEAELDGLLNGGPTHVEADAELATARYHLAHLTVEHAELGAQFTQLAYLVPLFGEQPNAVGGTLDATFEDLTATGRSSAELRSSLTGRGEVRFADGRLSSKPLDEIVAALAAFGLDTGFDPSEPGLEVNLLTSSFRIAEGRVLSDATLDSEGLDLEIAGSTGLDGSIDHRVVVLELNRILEKNPGLRKYITDAGQLPVTIKGTVKNPKVGIDAEQAVTDGLVDKLDDLISDGLDRLFGKKKDKKQAKPEEAPSPAEP